MFKLSLKLFLTYFVILTLTGCGGGGGGATDTTTSPTSASGSAIDNYIKDATVCIDANTNNICDTGETTTTTDSNGNFSFSNLSDNDIIIAYGGTDIYTGEVFPYILKNIASNKDSNGKIILSSLNTLISDYINAASSDLNTAKTKIASFLNATSDNLDEDIINKRTSMDTEFRRSLKLFQMIKKLNNGTNNSNNSALSFNALATAIYGDSTLEHNSTTITTSKGNASVLDTKPVFLNTTSVNVSEGTTTTFLNLDAVDPDNNTIYYTIIGGVDASLFSVDSNTSGKLYFKIAPNYGLPSDNGADNIYNLIANASDGTTDTNLSIIVNVTTSSVTVPTLQNTTFATIETNTTIGTNIGSVNVTSSGDSSIIFYEITSTSSKYDINSTTGNIKIKSGATLTVATDTIQVRAKNSAGYSNIVTVTIPVVSGGTLNTVPTLANNTLTIFENKTSGTSVGNVTLVSNGGSAITSYTFGNNNDESNLTLNTSTGAITSNAIFDYETKNTYTVTATATNTNGTSTPATITINVNDVNEQPVTTTIINDVNVSYGLTNTVSYDINDGDSLTTQTVTITSDTNNSNVTIGTITNNTFSDTSTISIPLIGANVGDTNVTIIMTDNGGIANGGDNNNSFSFIAHIRNNGWKIYDDQKKSNYTNNSVNFDNLTYTWDTINRWYISGTKILMPIKVLEKETNTGNNLTKIADGHYYVLTSAFINAAQKNATIYNTSDTFSVVSGGTPIFANNDNFQYDPEHNFFVSRIPKETVSTNTYTGQNYTFWIGQTQSYVVANDTNRSFATGEIFSSSYYTDNSDISDVSYNTYIDEKNDGNSTNNICASIYGDNWRLPTIYEMGINDDTSSNMSPLNSSNKGYIPAYVGNALAKIWSSSRYNTDTTKGIVFKQDSGTFEYANLSDTNQARCIYYP